MTDNSNSTSRLDRLEELMAVLITHSDATGQRVQQLAESQHLLHQDVQLVLHRMESVQADIRGLQTENRRILERLEAHFSNGHGGQ